MSLSVIGAKGSGWKGASLSTNSLRSFFAPHNSADRELAIDLDTLRTRSNQLYHNSPFCHALVNTISKRVVGTGIKHRPTIKKFGYEYLGLTEQQVKVWERKVQDLFSIWAEDKNCDSEKRCDFGQLQNLAFTTYLVGGDSFALPCFTKNNVFHLAIKILEGSRCQNPLAHFESDALMHGVEVDKNWAPVAYNFTNKPAWSIDNYSEFVDTVRVPAFDGLGNPNVFHIYSPERTEQRRGIPLFAPIILPQRNKDGYKDAESYANWIASCFTAVVENNDTEESEDLYGNGGELTEDDRGAVGENNGLRAPTQNVLEMQPGAVWSLAKGQQIKQLNPQRPNANYKPFVDDVNIESAAACGYSSAVVLNDFSGANYNAVRAALLGTELTDDVLCKNFVSDFCQPVYVKWLTNAVLLGIVDAPGFFDDPIAHSLWCGCRWIANSRFLLDPMKETQALKMQMDEQLISRDTACSMINGGEYDVVLNEIATEIQSRKDKGVGEPGAVSKTENFSVSTDNTEESSLN